VTSPKWKHHLEHHVSRDAHESACKFDATDTRTHPDALDTIVIHPGSIIADVLCDYQTREMHTRDVTRAILNGKKMRMSIVAESMVDSGYDISKRAAS